MQFTDVSSSSFFDSHPNAALLLDTHLIIQSVNEVAKLLFPQNIDQLTGCNFFDLVAHSHKKETQQYLQRALDGEKHLHFEISLTGAVPHLLIAKPVKLENNVLLLVLEMLKPLDQIISCCNRLDILEVQYERNPAGILLVNEKMEMLSYNQEFLRMWSIPVHILNAKNDAESLQTILSQLKYPDRFLKKVLELYHDTETSSTDEIELKDGRVFYRHSYPVNKKGRYLARVWYFLDITALKTAQKDVELQQRYQEAILEHINDGIVACDGNGKITLFNRASEKMLGKDLQDIPLDQWHHHLRLLSTEGEEKLKLSDLPLIKALGDQEVKNQEISVASPNKPLRTLRANGQAMVDGKNNKIGAVISLHDITDLKNIRQKLRHLAYHDHLTGLPNRRLFRDLIELCMRQADRERKMVGILFLDLDNFKQVNDRFGHDKGDDLLKQMAGVLKDCIRESDLICRWGGDEFVIAIPGISSLEDATLVAQKICKATSGIIATHMEFHGVTASIGISIYPRNGKVADQLIREADVAMLTAKNEGKNGFRYASTT